MITVGYKILGRVASGLQWIGEKRICEVRRQSEIPKEVMTMKSKTHVVGIESRWICRHLREKTTEIPKRCLLNFECQHCGFDQWLEEMVAVQRSRRAVSADKALAV